MAYKLNIFIMLKLKVHVNTLQVPRALLGWEAWALSPHDCCNNTHTLGKYLQNYSNKNQYIQQIYKSCKINT